MSEKEAAVKTLQDKLNAGKANDITFAEAKAAFGVELPDGVKKAFATISNFAEDVNARMSKHTAGVYEKVGLGVLNDWGVDMCDADPKAPNTSAMCNGFRDAVKTRKK